SVDVEGKSGRFELRPGERKAVTLFVTRYLRFTESGRYRLRVENVNRFSPAAPPFAVGETVITLKQPSAVEARQVFQKMKAARPEAYDRQAMQFLPDAADFQALHQPVYLPVLTEAALAGDRDAFISLGVMESRPATEVLVRAIAAALDRDDWKLARDGYEQLKSFLPYPNWYDPAAGEYYQPFRDRVARTWQPEFVPVLKRLARRLNDEVAFRLGKRGKQSQSTVDANDLDFVDGFRRGVFPPDHPQSLLIISDFIYRCLGEPDDFADCLQAFSYAIELAKSLPLETHQYFRPRGSAYGFRITIARMFERGAGPPTQPQHSGEAAAFAIALARNADFRPAGWSAELLKWLRGDDPYLAEVILDALPRPAPPEILDRIPDFLQHPYVDLQIAACRVAMKEPRAAFRQPLQQILDKATDKYLRKIAVDAARANDMSAEYDADAPFVDQQVKLLLNTEDNNGNKELQPRSDVHDVSPEEAAPLSRGERKADQPKADEVPAEASAEPDQAGDKTPVPQAAELSFLQAYPELSELNLSMTQLQFRGILQKLSLRFQCSLAPTGTHYQLDLADGHVLVVMFDGTENHCTGIQRIRGALPRPALVLADHLNVMAVAFQANSDTLVSLATESDVKIRRWNRPDQKLVREAKLDSDLHGNRFLMGHLRLADDGKSVFGIADGRLCLWNSETGAVVRKFSLPAEIEGSMIRDLAVTPDGKFVAVGLSDLRFAPGGRDARACVWEASTGRVLQTVVHPSAVQVQSVALSSDGTYLATGGQQFGTCLWDVASGQLVHDLANDNTGSRHPIEEVALPSASQVLALRFSPNGKTLAVADMLGVKLIAVSSGTELRRMSAPFRFGRSGLVFSRDGQLLARIATDHAVPIWDVATGQLLVELPTEAHCGDFSADGEWFATGFSDPKEALAVWRLRKGANAAAAPGKSATELRDQLPGKQVPAVQVARSEQVFERMVWQPKSQQIVAIGASSRCEVWQKGTNDWQSTVLPIDYHANSLAAGKAVNSTRVLLGTNVGTAELWDLIARRRLHSFRAAASHSVYAVALSPDETLAAACGTDGTVAVFDCQSGTEVARLGDKAETRMVSLTFSPDGQQLASLDRTGRLVIWNLKSQASVANWNVSASDDSLIQFTPARSELAISAYGSVTLVPTNAGSQVRVIRAPEAVVSRYPETRESKSSGPQPGGIRYASLTAVAPDGKRVASLTPAGELVIWNLDDRRILERLPGPPRDSSVADLEGAGLQEVMWSVDGRQLAATSKRGGLAIWSLASSVPESGGNAPAAEPKTAGNGDTDEVSEHGEIRGSVVDLKGHPVAGLTIACGAVINDSLKGGGANAVTTAAGTFRLVVPSPGIYNVWLKQSPDPALVAAADEALIVAAGQVTDSRLVVFRGTKMMGVLLDEHDQPVPDATVFFHSFARPTAGGPESIKTDQAGRFSPVLVPGQAYFYMNPGDRRLNPANGRSALRAEAWVVVPPRADELEANRSLRLQLQPHENKIGDPEWVKRSSPGTQIVARANERDVTGTVVDEQGAPVADAQVFRYDGPVLNVDETAQFRVPAPKGTQFIMHAYAPGYRIWTGTPSAGDVLRIVMQKKLPMGVPKDAVQNRRVPPATAAEFTDLIRAQAALFNDVRLEVVRDFEWKRPIPAEPQRVVKTRGTLNFLRLGPWLKVEGDRQIPNPAPGETNLWSESWVAGIDDGLAYHWDRSAKRIRYGALHPEVANLGVNEFWAIEAFEFLANSQPDAQFQLRQETQDGHVVWDVSLVGGGKSAIRYRGIRPDRGFLPEQIDIETADHQQVQLAQLFEPAPGVWAPKQWTTQFVRLARGVKRAGYPADRVQSNLTRLELGAAARLRENDFVFRLPADAQVTPWTINGSQVLPPNIRRQRLTFVGDDASGAKPIARLQISILRGWGDSQKTLGRFQTDNTGTIDVLLPLGYYRLALDSERELPYLAVERRWNGRSRGSLPVMGLNVTPTGVEKRMGDFPPDYESDPTAAEAGVPRITYHLLPGCSLVLRAVDAETGTGLRGAEFYQENAVGEDWADRVVGQNLGSRKPAAELQPADLVHWQTDEKGEFRRLVGANAGFKYGIKNSPPGYEPIEAQGEIDLPIVYGQPQAEHTFKFKRVKTEPGRAVSDNDRQAPLRAQAEANSAPESITPAEYWKRPVTLRVKDRPLESVIEDLAAQSGLQIEWDREALSKAKIALDRIVAVDLDAVRLEAAFSRFMDWNSLIGMSREIVGNRLVITTYAARAEKIRRQLPAWLQPHYNNGLLANVSPQGEVETITAGQVVDDELLARIAGLPVLRELYIEYTANLTAAGLKSLREMRVLEKLTLHGIRHAGQGLGDVAIRQLIGLPALRDLKIGECGTTDDGALLLEQLTKLESLALSQEGRLTGAALRSIGKLTRLRSLSLPSFVATQSDGRMQFSADDVAELRDLRDLETLDLTGHAVAAKDLDFPSLRHLRLGHDSIDELVVRRIAQLPELRGLGIGSSRIRDESLQTLSVLSKLEYLSVYSTALSGAGFVHLSQLERLQHVDLKCERLTDEALRHLAKIKTLTRIDLNCSHGPRQEAEPQITIEGLQQLRELPHLETLWLSGLHLEDVRGLAELKHLRSLMLMQTPALPADLEYLQEVMPNTAVSYASGGGDWLPKRMRNLQENKK
ncbi:MAG: hypothetical protein JSS02_19845, partial [Planctomycetes bacterium]|nr:hypothetical protein [Planctomycetota bacterium]